MAKTEEDKIIKYGKKIIAIMFLFILLFFDISNSSPIGGIAGFLFVLTIYFIFIEIIIFLSNRIKILKIKSVYVNLVLLLVLSYVLNYILIKYTTLFLFTVAASWSFKHIFTVRKLQVVIIILLTLIFSLPIVQSYRVELFYRITGKVIKRQIEISRSENEIETISMRCKMNQPFMKCVFIRGKRAESGNICEENRSVSQDSKYFVDCYYGCSSGSYYE